MRFWIRGDTIRIQEWMLRPKLKKKSKRGPMFVFRALTLFFYYYNLYLYITFVYYYHQISNRPHKSFDLITFTASPPHVFAPHRDESDPTKSSFFCHPPWQSPEERYGMELKRARKTAKSFRPKHLGPVAARGKGPGGGARIERLRFCGLC